MDVGGFQSFSYANSLIGNKSAAEARSVAGSTICLIVHRSKQLL